MELYNWRRDGVFGLPSHRHKTTAKTAWTQKAKDSSSKNLKKYSAFKPYVKALLRVSLLTGVPQIVANRSWTKRSIMILVISLCIVGFVYQTLDFLRLYRAYPTTVNILTSHPTEIVQPAITFCNANRVRRSVYCGSERAGGCSSMKTDILCETYPIYCPPGKKPYSQLPNLDAYLPEIWYWDEVLEEAHNTSMIHWCYKINEGKKKSCSTNYQMVPVVTKDSSRTLCYAIESHWNKPDAKADVYPNTFAIHDRNRIVNPFEEGQGLLAGKIYEAKVSLIETEMLPSPYDTNCRDYKESWRKNNGTGPLNDLMCIEECKLKTLVSNKLCIDENVNYPNMEENCFKGEFTATDEIVEKCSSACEKPCKDQFYEVKYSEITNFKAECNNSKHCEHDRLRILISFRTFKVTKYLYMPKFESVELFSYIGGYMGMWLGASLVSLFDLFLTIVEIFYFPIRHLQWKMQKRKTNALNNIMVRSIPEYYNYPPQN